ncbi:MAG: hypothetical protein U1E87_05150 [Alphaproteobacteria bacterium]
MSEPYRMFTSRSEFRLSLRADNADRRLTRRGIDTGCVSTRRAESFCARVARLEAGLALARSLSLTSSQAAKAGLKVNQDGIRRTAVELLAHPLIAFEDLQRVWPELHGLAGDVRAEIETEAVYAGYLERQEADIASFRREEGFELPADLDYAGIAGLSKELIEKLSAQRPATLGQAGRLDGMTPAALLRLLQVARRVSA